MMFRVVSFLNTKRHKMMIVTPPTLLFLYSFWEAFSGESITGDQMFVLTVVSTRFKSALAVFGLWEYLV